MALSKEVALHISYFIDDPETWLSFMLTCKNAKAACDYRKEQKQWQFKKVIIPVQVDEYGTIFPGVCESKEAFGKVIEDHVDQNARGILLTASPQWGRGNITGFTTTRLELLRKCGMSPI